MEKFAVRIMPDKHHSKTRAVPKGDTMIRVSLSTEPQNPSPRTTLKKPCTHSRLVDVVVSPQGTHTGQLLCMECTALFPDPRFQQPVH